jgi:large exoprotein involved in heme utilization and adhesion
MTGLLGLNPVALLSPGGPGGNITLTANSLTATEGAKISATTEGAGNAGNITLNLTTLNLNDGSSILASAAGSGKGGTVTVNASQAAQLGQGVQDAAPVISVETSGAGRAGDIIINTPILTILDTARITATATATATNTEGGGSIILNASQMNLRGTVGIFAETQGQAPAGTLTLKPYQSNPTLDIALASGSQISASTAGSGNGGDLLVQAPQTITIAGAGKLAVETSSSGNAGRLSVTTQQLTLKDGVELSASSTGSGRAGDITFTAQNFNLLSGAKVTTTTSGTGAAGNIIANVVNNFALDGQGTGLFASTDPGSSGQGGSIFIDPQRVTLSNGAVISVNSQGSGNGGNIQLQAGNLTLTNQGAITAETASGEGGNITLRVDNRLLLRTNSLISATAGGTGTGGNLDIRTGEFIIAVPYENSDIIANAFQGKGGNVNITTQAIFGLEFRSRLTPLSDITASSEFGLQGNVVINTPNVDPSRGIVHLPSGITDASQQIAQGCRPASEAGRFVVTGRGGLPTDPTELLADEVLWDDLRGGGATQAQTEGQPSQPTPNATAQGLSLVPAQGWVIDDKGMVTLVASPHQLACSGQPKPRL